MEYLRKVRGDSLLFIELKGNIFALFFFKGNKIVRTPRKMYQTKIFFTIVSFIFYYQISPYCFLSSLTVRLLSLLEGFFFFPPATAFLSHFWF